jgi:2-iminobutanoate/2-iminopropanoate deaminase
VNKAKYKREVIAMETREINVQGIPKGGAYSHAVEAGGFIFLSGMVPIDPDKKKPITDDFQLAFKAVLESIRSVLNAAGSDTQKIVKVTIFLKNMKDFQSMNELYEGVFVQNQPARTTVPTPELPFPLEIDVIAVK